MWPWILLLSEARKRVGFEWGNKDWEKRCARTSFLAIISTPAKMILSLSHSHTLVWNSCLFFPYLSNPGSCLDLHGSSQKEIERERDRSNQQGCNYFKARGERSDSWTRGIETKVSPKVFELHSSIFSWMTMSIEKEDMMSGGDSKLCSERHFLSVMKLVSIKEHQHFSPASMTTHTFLWGSKQLWLTNGHWLNSFRTF